MYLKSSYTIFLFLPEGLLKEEKLNQNTNGIIYCHD